MFILSTLSYNEQTPFYLQFIQTFYDSPTWKYLSYLLNLKLMIACISYQTITILLSRISNEQFRIV